MKRAEFWKKIKGRKVQCELCPHYCVIKEGECGKCKVRKNVGWKLYALNYDYPVSTNIDPIEKKPLFHFFPGSKSFSIGMAGCNLRCDHCQNYLISQKGSEEFCMKKFKVIDVVKKAVESGCKSISYTYTEPLVSYEYIIEIMMLAKKKGLKNVIVSNGFINPEPLKKLCEYIDGANIDLKAMSDEFYRKNCGGRLKPVLESLRLLKKNKIWLEVTNLLIPGKNTNEQQIKKLINWVGENLGKNVPLHFSGFFPTYKLSNLEPTSKKILNKSLKIGKEKMKYVYVGNIRDEEGENTICPKCGEIVIDRSGYEIIYNKLKKGECLCGKKISGVWE